LRRPGKNRTKQSFHAAIAPKNDGCGQSSAARRTRTRSSGSHQRKMPVVEAKAKAVATDEKAKPVAKQVAAPGEKSQPIQVASKASKTAASATQQYTVACDDLSQLAERF